MPCQRAGPGSYWTGPPELVGCRRQWWHYSVGGTILRPLLQCGRRTDSPLRLGRMGPPSAGSLTPMTGQNSPSPSITHAAMAAVYAGNGPNGAASAVQPAAAGTTATTRWFGTSSLKPGTFVAGMSRPLRSATKASPPSPHLSTSRMYDFSPSSISADHPVGLHFMVGPPLPVQSIGSGTLPALPRAPTSRRHSDACRSRRWRARSRRSAWGSRCASQPADGDAGPGHAGAALRGSARTSHGGPRG